MDNNARSLTLDFGFTDSYVELGAESALKLLEPDILLLLGVPEDTFNTLFQQQLIDEILKENYDFIEDLLEKGIPKEDIILAFHAPYKRPYTGFGVGI